MLGLALSRVLADRHEVVALPRADLDVTDLPAVQAALARWAPDAVLHAAAWTDVDGCQRDPDRAFRVNGLGARNVALGCQATGVGCCYISTDYVFDGAKAEPYTEFDPPNPISVYGASKLAGERAVRALTPRHWIVRTSWLYGPGGKNFVKTMLARGRAGEELRVVDDQLGSPTYTLDLAHGISRLLEEPRYGLWHLTNSLSCTWYEFAAHILESAGLGAARLEPILSKDLDRPAPRPKNSVLRNYCWELEGWPRLRAWTEALREYLAHPELAE